jgi:formylglycine-generating enzyme required for sulfatase activity
MKKFFLILVIIILLILTGCDDETTEPEDQDVVVSETTEVVETEVANEEIEAISEEGDFTVDESSELADLEIGEIMLNGGSDVAPSGFLRKVTDKRTENGKVILETEQASMAEAFEELHLSETVRLTPADVQRVELFNDSRYISERDDIAFNFELNTVFYDQDGNNGTTDDQIRLDGNLEFILDLIADIDINWFTLETMELGLQTEKNLDLDLTAGLHWSFEEESSFDIAELYFTPIVFTVVFVPVTITPILSVEAHVNGDLTVTITTGIEYEETTRTGVGYDNGDWYEIKQNDKNFDYYPPELQAEFDFETGVGLQLGFYLYGAIGPYLKAKGGLHFQADLVANPSGTQLNMDLEAILYAICGLEMEVLDHTIFDEYMEFTIYTHQIGSWTFDIDENEPPGIPFNPVPANYSSNIAVNTDLSWSCNDPDGDDLTYDVYFGNSSNPPLIEQNQSVSTYNPGSMIYEITYYWKIIASDGEFESSSPVWSFSTESGGGVNNPPNEPYDPTPSDNADNVSINTNLNWSGSDPDGDDLTYDVYWGTDPTPDSGELVSEDQAGTSFDPGTMQYEITYYWKIVASDGEYETSSSVWNYTTSEETNYGDMIFVQGGSFEMGDHFNEGSGDELPVHTVTLNSFYIGQYEVTHTEYIEFLNSYGVSPDGSYNGTELIDMDDSDCAVDYNGSFYFSESSYASDPECPVIEVTWYGGLVYCNWLSEQEGLTPCYDTSDWSCDFGADGYRLPTEAEWEYASRGGINWEDNYRYSGTTDNLGDYAWYLSNSGFQTHEVGTKLPNQLSIYDMSGNVWEWCNDWYGSSYYGSSPEDNPVGPDSGSYRVKRGGGWFYDASYCRVAYRLFNLPGSSHSDIGFRILRAYSY